MGHVDDGKVVVTKHGWDPWRAFALRLYDRMMNFEEEGFDVIVMEDWRLTKRGAQTLLGSDLPSSQCLGAIRLAYDLARRAGHGVRLVTQAPAHKYVVDSWMGGTGYLPASEVEHNRDAIRHLYYYALNPANETGAQLAPSGQVG
jgi:hypothetical protein